MCEEGVSFSFVNTVENGGEKHQQQEEEEWGFSFVSWAEDWM